MFGAAVESHKRRLCLDDDDESKLVKARQRSAANRMKTITDMERTYRVSVSCTPLSLEHQPTDPTPSRT